jgi:hypothetical protein
MLQGPSTSDEGHMGRLFDRNHTGDGFGWKELRGSDHAVAMHAADTAVPLHLRHFLGLIATFQARAVYDVRARRWARRPRNMSGL